MCPTKSIQISLPSTCNPCEKYSERYSHWAKGCPNPSINYFYRMFYDPRQPEEAALVLVLDWLGPYWLTVVIVIGKKK